MAKIKYLIKGNNNPTNIYLRFKHGRKVDITKGTNFYIDPKNWNTNKGQPKPKDPSLKNMATELFDLSNSIIKEFNTTPIDEITPDWLQLQIDIFKGNVKPNQSQSDILTECIQNFIDNAGTRKNGRGGLGLSKSRIGTYETLLKLIKRYAKGKTFRVKDVDLKFKNSFLNWLINEEEYAESYALKKIDDLKTVCMDARIYGIEINTQLLGIKSMKAPKNDIIYLSRLELLKIEKANLLREAHKNARKWLLLGCNIGQRGGDLLKITHENFVTRDDMLVIELEQQKTGKLVTIPVLEKTEEILQDGLPHPISTQKFNKYIKEVCQIAEIDDLVKGSKLDKEKNRKIKGRYPKYDLIASHVCRRSFATNHYGELPTPLLMQITGHGTEKMFLQYIGKNSLDYAKQIKDYYELRKLKNKKEPQLNVVKKSIGQ